MFRKFSQPFFFEAYLALFIAWVMIGRVLIAVCIWPLTYTLYWLFFAELLPLEEWGVRLVVMELLIAMYWSWDITKSLVAPWINRHILCIFW